MQEDMLINCATETRNSILNGLGPTLKIDYFSLALILVHFDFPEAKLNVTARLKQIMTH